VSANTRRGRPRAHTTPAAPFTSGVARPLARPPNPCRQVRRAAYLACAAPRYSAGIRPLHDVRVEEAPETLIEEADAAVYQAKRAGKVPVVRSRPAASTA